MSNIVDPYIDKSTGILRNLVGAVSSHELQTIEPQIVFANELELESHHIPRTNDTFELLAIHRQLFSGVYDWAGTILTVDIKKNDEGAEFFLIVDKITLALNFIFNELKKEEFLTGLSVNVFIERIAYFYDQLNYIHPFREGNGRAQRIFWSRVARDAGYDIDWSKIVGHENDEASRIAAEELDLSALKKMFTKIVSQLQE